MQIPEMTIDTSSLLKEIESVFPFVEMPDENELVFHENGCLECNDLKNELKDYRNKEITGEVIRLLYIEMTRLSAKGWQWILPHYLRYCLPPEADYNCMETELLIYSCPNSEKSNSSRSSAAGAAAAAGAAVICLLAPELCLPAALGGAAAQ